MIRKIFIFLLILLIVIQFIRPSNDNNASMPNAANINNFTTVSSELDQVLKTSCYDCHSNKTNYPWYTNVQPLAWWLEDHINEGKKSLNFDEYGKYNLRRRYHKMEEIAEMVEQDEMPLKSYTLIHTSAKLNPEQKRQVVGWADKVRADMKAKYPIDSLVRQK